MSGVIVGVCLWTKPPPFHKQSHPVGPSVGFWVSDDGCSLKMDVLLYIPQAMLAKKVGLGLVVGVEDGSSFQFLQKKPSATTS